MSEVSQLEYYVLCALTEGGSDPLPLRTVAGSLRYAQIFFDTRALATMPEQPENILLNDEVLRKTMLRLCQENLVESFKREPC